MITVNEVMSTQVITLKASDSVSAARELMKKEDIRHIPIVNDNLVPVGLVTQRDILSAQNSNLTNGKGHPLDENSVLLEQIMSDKIAYVHPSDPLRSAGIKIQKHKYGCLPVIDNNRLVGIITDSDFVGVAINLIEQVEQSEDF